MTPNSTWKDDFARQLENLRSEMMVAHSLTVQSVYRGATGKKHYQQLRSNYLSALPEIRQAVVKAMVAREQDAAALQRARVEMESFRVEVALDINIRRRTCT